MINTVLLHFLEKVAQILGFIAVFAIVSFVQLRWVEQLQSLSGEDRAKVVKVRKRNEIIFVVILALFLVLLVVMASTG